MKITRLFLVIVLFATSCSSSRTADAKLGTLTYEVPSGWVSKDLSGKARDMVQWTPSGDNDRRESVVIARVEQPALAKAKTGYLSRLLDDAQKNRPEGRFAPSTKVETRHGLSGAKTEGWFTPPGQKTAYHRIHAVFTDGASVVTVIYTAREPDREAFETVLDSLRSNRGA